MWTKVRLHYPLVEGMTAIKKTNNAVVTGVVVSITDVSKFDALGHSL
jgi:hypothetical protein